MGNGKWDFCSVSLLFNESLYSFILSHSILVLNHCINYHPEIKYEEGGCGQFQ